MIKKALAALLCGAVAAGSLVSCGKKLPVETSTTAGEAGSSQTQGQQDQFVATDIKNFTAPEVGDQIIIMNIRDYGEVRIRLFPEYLPKAVENFVTLAEQGYYDGLIFHRVINEFMIQGGDPLGNGTGGQSCWGGKFDGGTDTHLVHVTGALAYANSGPMVEGGSPTATDGSQYYIVTGTVPTEEDFALYESYGYSFTDEQKQLYEQYGGYPSLDGNYTVFGQVIDGLDIILKIEKVATNSSNRPIEDVVVDSVKVGTYNGEEIRFYRSDYDLSGIGEVAPNYPDADYENAEHAAKEYLEACASKDAEAIYDKFSSDEIASVNKLVTDRLLESNPDASAEDFSEKISRSNFVNFLTEQLAEDITADGLEPKINKDTDLVYYYTYDDISNLQSSLLSSVEAAIMYSETGLVSPEDPDTYAFQPSAALLVFRISGEWHVSYYWQAYDFLFAAVDEATSVETTDEAATDEAAAE
jgi:cyclophilin family peptidyl-prolyl cis-trans isomerase